MEQGAGGNEDKLLRRKVQAAGKEKADGGRDGESHMEKHGEWPEVKL